MNKRKPHLKPSLGDLILAVSSVSRNNSEAVAAVADLLESGHPRTICDCKLCRNLKRKPEL